MTGLGSGSGLVWEGENYSNKGKKVSEILEIKKGK